MTTGLLHKGLTAPATATPKRAVKVAPEGIVTAIVAVTGVEDMVDDLIVPGAFTASLAIRRPKVVDDHEWKNKVGRVLHVEEWMPGDPRLPKRTKDGKPWPKAAGALVATMQYNLNAVRGAEAYEWVRFYAESNEAEFSIGYKVPDGKARKRADGVRVILMVNLFEFSHVLFGAAPLSMALEVKGLHGGSAGTVTAPAITGADDEDETYDDVDAPAPTAAWDDIKTEKTLDDDDEDLVGRAPMEAKTAAAVLRLEAKEGGADRNRGNAENLRQWFLSPESGIGWGTDGDHTRCVAVASKHMTVDQAQGYCQLRHKEATGMYTGDAEHKSLPDIESKAFSRMKGSYEERIALLEDAARDVVATLRGCSVDDVSVMTVATYATESVINAWCRGEVTSYLFPYTALDDGRVDIGEPTPVELSLVAEQPNNEPVVVADAAAFGEFVQEKFDALQAAGATETKSADPAEPAESDPEEEFEEPPADEDDDPDTYSADNLPDGEWAPFRKTEPIQALRMDGPFTVKTREGVVECEDGWLALDSDAYPYPIATDEFENVYAPDGEPAEKDAEGDPAEMPESDVEAADPEAAAVDDVDDEGEPTVKVSPDEHFAVMDELAAGKGDDPDA